MDNDVNLKLPDYYTSRVDNTAKNNKNNDDKNDDDIVNTNDEESDAEIAQLDDNSLKIIDQDKIEEILKD